MDLDVGTRRGRCAEPRSTRVTDERLVERAIAGDRTAFERLVRRHQRPLVNHLFRQVGQRELALDLAQEVFLKVYLSLDAFDPRFRFTTWLYRIASNRAIDHLRKKTPRTCSLSGDAEDGRGEDSLVRLVGRGPSPDEVLRFRELRRRIDDAVAELPPEFRQLILLRHRQHCRYDEIARITDLPLGTVKNRIFRAREALRRSLADVLDEDQA